MKTYPFNALVSRMKYIRRWSLMHAARPETLSEHTAETAILAHTLCLIAREVTGTPVKSQVRYHSPATAPAGNTSSSHPLLSPRVRRPVRIRHNSATPPRAVENTNAVGL